MRRQMRDIIFYKIQYSNFMPTIKEYSLRCTRSWWKCMKLGLKHIKQGKATFFYIEKVKPKKS